MKNLFKKLKEKFFADPQVVVLLKPHGQTGFLDGELARLMAYSLRRGSNRREVLINPRVNRKSDCVLACDPESLAGALAQKQSEDISFVAAGPVLDWQPAVPVDPRIDLILAPTEAIKESWISHDQAWQERIAVWRPGVLDRGVASRSKGTCLIYARGIKKEFFDKVATWFWEQDFRFDVYDKDEFDERAFDNLLKKSSWVLYLNEEPTDHLPLYAAWMANVPTLVYSKKMIEVPTTAGVALTDEDELRAALSAFVAGKEEYAPRAHALASHTDKVAAGRLLSIVRGYSTD
ncbi:MAG: hypothetical protein COU11_01410 [Candidatus Harrisonbacteria bacterium CG10_big_fil_rev_8_21_14_0_10_49_15]|uniref:Glycosyl transferase family 1 domain-containing protein n=1 Tax=Candidatus Harrisonbacteria bacterium CG10_big_fil_rev_8_21_14_0_10_49_15 TaxID=1974587 RepID=A0A2H0ULJ9_9BACT|nr:MAG: hypothetical protein COU11_01410 [Candidatus Harrisonbacteria bacterium CG10_big_fil_rev_8_21_14_0_10_49_15]